ncbi:MAG TPA: ATP-grasp domain-containing protein [Bdellovibrionota bacterium]|jgi:5-(carboxyamino)imidazole ribonucleotide synthase
MATQRTVITLGNGQLGLMLGKAAKRLEIPFSALSLPEAWNWLKGSEIADNLVTFEQEHVDEELLKAISAKGLSSFPSWACFNLLKSKRSQKEFMLQSKIPSSPFLVFDKWGEAAERFLKENSGGVLKAGRGGYDGKGVWLVDAQGRTKEGKAASEIAASIQQPYLERKIAFTEEIAAVVCRSSSGKTELYPTVRSIQLDGICFQVEYTRDFASTKVAQKAGEIARKIATELDYVGVLAVECFVTGDEVLVNEIAPRVHNSGHFTIDVCAGSQFENHLRAGLDLPLGRTEPTHPAAVMVNLLWPPSEKEFAPLFAKLTCGPDWPENVKLHWYGKSEVRPRRKMGHFTVYGNSLEECRKTAAQILASRWVQG